MSNIRFNTVSTHPSKKWDMRLVHAILLCTVYTVYGKKKDKKCFIAAL